MAPPRPAASRRTLTLLVVPIIAFVIASWVGDALAPSLFDTHPAWLIALNARNRNLALVTNYIDAVTYYVVGTLRLLASDPLFYLLGYFFGDRALEWMESRTATAGQMLRQFEKWFAKAAYPLVVIAPNNLVCLFAGSAGMAPVVFLVLNLTGTIGRLVLIRWLGDIFSSPIDSIRGFIADYRIPMLVLSFAFVGWTIWRETRTGEVGALVELERELADEEHAQAAHAEAEAEADGAGAAADGAVDGDRHGDDLDPR